MESRTTSNWVLKKAQVSTVKKSIIKHKHKKGSIFWSRLEAQLLGKGQFMGLCLWRSCPINVPYPLLDNIRVMVIV